MSRLDRTPGGRKFYGFMASGATLVAIGLLLAVPDKELVIGLLALGWWVGYWTADVL